MTKALSVDLRDRVVAVIEGGLSRRQAAARFGVSVSSAIHWHTPAWRTGTATFRRQGGDRRSGQIEAHADAILAAAAKQPDIDGPSIWWTRLMCRVFEVSASGNYAWRSRPESARSVANRKLLINVRRLHAEHHGRYGSPRIHATLRAEGRTASRGRVERLMRRHGIRALAGHRFRPCTTDSRHHLPIASNLLQQEFVATALNRV